MGDEQCVGGATKTGGGLQPSEAFKFAFGVTISILYWTVATMQNAPGSPMLTFMHCYSSDDHVDCLCSQQC